MGGSCAGRSSFVTGVASVATAESLAADDSVAVRPIVEGPLAAPFHSSHAIVAGVLSAAGVFAAKGTGKVAANWQKTLWLAGAALHILRGPVCPEEGLQPLVDILGNQLADLQGSACVCSLRHHDRTCPRTAARSAPCWWRRRLRCSCCRRAVCGG